MKIKERFSALVAYLIIGTIAAGSYYLSTHHWSNSPVLAGGMLGFVLMAVTRAYLYVVKLMERQNALLEQVLGVLEANRHEYEEPLGRR